MPICPHCGQDHPAIASFCPKTGLPIDFSEQDAAPLSGAVPERPPIDATQVVGRPTVEKPGKAFNPIYFLIGGGALLVCLGAVLIAFALIRGLPGLIPEKANPAPTRPVAQVDAATPATGAEDQKPPEVLPPTVPFTQAPLPSPSPLSTFTATITLTPEPTRPSFTSQVNPKDQAGMVLVPAGKFIMGSDPEVDPYFWGAESPRHEVTLDEYWIYQTEVTNAMYEQCATEKACPLPSQKKSRQVGDYYGNLRYATYPVIFVNWVSAQAYCRWAGGRLPTEAEWEKAARGDQDTRLFPWGNTPALASQANFCDAGCAQAQADRDKNDGYPDTSPVGAYPEGISPYGAYDMAGNVWEWVFDWFQPTYGAAAVENPVGPASSKYRTIRGGSWYNPSAGVRIVQRDGVRPDLSLDTLGFRCVVEAQP